MDQDSEYARFEQCSTLEKCSSSAGDADTWLSTEINSKHHTEVEEEQEVRPTQQPGSSSRNNLLLLHQKKSSSSETPLKRKKTVASQPPRILPKENSGSGFSTSSPTPLTKASHSNSSPSVSGSVLVSKKDSNQGLERGAAVGKMPFRVQSPPPQQQKQNEPAAPVIVLSLQSDAAVTDLHDKALIDGLPSDTVSFRPLQSPEEVRGEESDVTCGARFAAFQTPPNFNNDPESMLYLSFTEQAGGEPLQPASNPGPTVTSALPRLCLFTREVSPQMQSIEEIPAVACLGSCDVELEPSPPPPQRLSGHLLSTPSPLRSIVDSHPNDIGRIEEASPLAASPAQKSTETCGATCSPPVGPSPPAVQQDEPRRLEDEEKGTEIQNAPVPEKRIPREPREESSSLPERPKPMLTQPISTAVTRAGELDSRHTLDVAVQRTLVVTTRADGSEESRPGQESKTSPKKACCSIM
jgi:hypothetical protein